MTRKKKRTVCLLSIAGVLLLALVIWTVWGNTALELNTYAVKSTTLPADFDGYRIAHISDLHNAQLGENNETLLQMLKHAQPDIIAITGDLIDSRNTNLAVALNFAREAVKIAPCYYVSGNHEARIAEYEHFKADLTALGVVVLEDEKLTLRQGSSTITLCGVNDPSFQTDYLTGDAAAVMTRTLQQLLQREENYTLLLSHRPELLEIYAENGVDLVLSGHAHGGQFRLPLIGGLFAPNQGLFPEYDASLFTSGGTCMIVSRGIGNSFIPFRFNNRPEVILIELQAVS